MKNRIIELRKKASRAKRNSKNKTDDFSCLRLIQLEGNTFVYFYSRPVAIFPSDDLFSRNIAVINIYLNHKIKQIELARVFGLSERRINQLVTLYRYKGMAGLAGPDPARFSTENETHADSDETDKEGIDERVTSLVVQGRSISNQDSYFTRISSADESGAWTPIQ